MSKYIIFSLLLFYLTIHGSAQNVDSLIQVGNSLRKTGNYQQAIKAYLKALEFDKKSTNTKYEIAYTYLLLNDFKNAIRYCNGIIKSNHERTIEAYILKCSAFENSGKSKKSERLYIKAIKTHPDNYLLNYNLGITYYNNNQLANAKIQFLKAIEIDNLQANSHYMLGLLMNETGNRVQSMFSLYFYLMLEPNTDNSAEAYKMLIKQWAQNTKADSLNSSRITIKHNPKNINYEFNAIDLSVSSTYALNSEKEREKKNKYEFLISNTTSLFNLIGNYKEYDNDIWHNLYFAFFNDLFKANQVEPFCYYISSTCDDEMINGWLEYNKDKIEGFSTWTNRRLQGK